MSNGNPKPMNHPFSQFMPFYDDVNVENCFPASDFAHKQKSVRNISGNVRLNFIILICVHLFELSGTKFLKCLLIFSVISAGVIARPDTLGHYVNTTWTSVNRRHVFMAFVWTKKMALGVSVNQVRVSVLLFSNVCLNEKSILN